jgi:hypothetical protein
MPNKSLIHVGSTLQYTATGTYTDGSTADISTSVTWASSIPSIATISGTGLATAIDSGITSISATLGAVSGSTSLTVTTAYTSIVEGTTQQFIATGTYTDSLTANMTTTVTWSSC